MNISKILVCYIFIAFTLMAPSISFGENQTLTIKTAEMANFKSLYMPEVTTINIVYVHLEDISWINASFPNVERINIILGSLRTGQEYGKKILLLLQQMSAFPYLQNVSFKINKIPIR